MSYEVRPKHQEMSGQHVTQDFQYGKPIRHERLTAAAIVELSHGRL